MKEPMTEDPHARACRLIPLMTVIFIVAACVVWAVNAHADCKDEIVKNDMDWIQAVEESVRREDALMQKNHLLNYELSVREENDMEGKK